ncbi:hypothetical protein VPH35_059853 [Triticum aestivum]
MRGAGPDLVSAGPSSRRFAGGPTQQWRARCVGGARSNGGTGRPRPAAWEWLHRVKAWPVLTGRRRRRLWASLSSLEALSGIFTASTPGSSPSGESPDPATRSGGVVVFNAVPLFRAPS